MVGNDVIVGILFVVLVVGFRESCDGEADVCWGALTCRDGKCLRPSEPIRKVTENPCATGCPHIDPESKSVISCTSSPDVCSADSVCTEPKRDTYTVCCDKPTAPCSFGKPLRDQATNTTVFCGRGPTRQDCPTTHECNIAPDDTFAVCCPVTNNARCKTARMSDNPCEAGCPRIVWKTESKNVTSCASSPDVCSSNEVCKEVTKSKAKPSVCCPRPTGPCTNGEPLIDTATNMAVFCGRGPTRQDCPKTHKCNIASNDSFAVCCPVKNQASCETQWKYNKKGYKSKI